jgi:hypothetical protein
MQKMSNYESCVLYTWTEKKELKLRSAPVSVHIIIESKLLYMSEYTNKQSKYTCITIIYKSI